jgi:hypothetical protein
VLSRLYDAIEFSPHFVFAHCFRIDAAEAALRTECRLFERDVVRSFVDAAFEFIERLQNCRRGQRELS